MSTFLYRFKTWGQQLVWEIVKRTATVHSVSYHMLVATKKCTKGILHDTMAAWLWTRVHESGHGNSAGNWNCMPTYKVGLSYIGRHFILTLFVGCCSHHHTSCRHQACCVDRIWSRTSQIPVSLNQFESTCFVESTASVYLTSVVLKKIR